MENLNGQNENSSVLSKSEVRDFLQEREVSPEDLPLIEDLAAMPKSDLTVEFHNLFNSSKERSGNTFKV